MQKKSIKFGKIAGATIFVAAGVETFVALATLDQINIPLAV